MTEQPQRPTRVVVWGTYDVSKPRTRILLSGLRATGMDVLEIHADIWSEVQDKSQVRGLVRYIFFLARLMAAYPRLLYLYIRAPCHDVVMIGYLGHLDVLVIRLLAWIRRVPVAWDMFISIYDTVVQDRRLVHRRNPIAWGLWWWEWAACRAADVVVIDTVAHGRSIRQMYSLPETRVSAVYVGAELDQFPRASWTRGDDKDEIDLLFYGQFIPLHGIETIVAAARMAKVLPFRWTLIGKGQEEGRIRSLIESDSSLKLRWIPWLPYELLNERIAQADICLGIFGNSVKAANVIPNKVFQILAVGRPLITRDSPAIRELVSPETPGVKLVPPANPGALIAAVRELSEEGIPQPPANLRDMMSPLLIGASLELAFERAREKAAVQPRPK